jgi:tungstate transport system substrate-binding protein
MGRVRPLVAIAAALVLIFPGEVRAAPETLRLATTTSTEASGLLRVILPKFEAASGLKVQVISVGTGRALKLGEEGDVDVLLVHSRPDEDRFVARGFGVNRRDVMYNDFVLVGPKEDPAKVRGTKDIVAAFRRILEANATFVSRGDESGTESAEKRYWALVGKPPSGRQYVSVGQGMRATLRIANELGAYTLSDRATAAARRARPGQDILLEGDPRLHNPYGVIAVSPARFPQVNAKGAAAFIEWLTGREGRRAIVDFRASGEQVFFISP